MAGLPNGMGTPSRFIFLGGPPSAEQGPGARQLFHGAGHLAVANIISNPGQYNVKVGFLPDNASTAAGGLSQGNRLGGGGPGIMGVGARPPLSSIPKGFDRNNSLMNRTEASTGTNASGRLH